MNNNSPSHLPLDQAVKQAQQKLVDKGFLPPIQRNWDACLAFAYHTQEEAWEVIRELPRKPWKHQEVNPENLLSELADTQIQLLTTLMYAGYTQEELEQAIHKKLTTKRPDWK